MRAICTWAPAVLLGCSSPSSTGPGSLDASTAPDVSARDAAGADSGAIADAGPDGEAGLFDLRPYTVVTPAGYDPSQPAPLVIMIHGYGTDGPDEESYLQLAPTANDKGFLYAYGTGTINVDGYRFWNATNACCDFYDSPADRPDDVAYADALIDGIESNYNVDPKRIYLIGHSNGGYMSHRIACDEAGRIAAIVSFAGAQWIDPTQCQPSGPVSIVELHGDQDVEYDPATGEYGTAYGGGTTLEGPYPSAPATVQTWADKNGCTGALGPTGQTYDLVPGVPSDRDASASDDAARDGTPSDRDGEADPNETVVQSYACDGGIDVQLWTMRGVGHMPALNTGTLGEAVWSFFAAHPKP